MSITKIVDGLERLGVKPGGTVLVHSSLKALGHVGGGAETVVMGLLSTLGPHGTLLMPALSYQTVTSASPVFDIRETPSCVGAISEHFRNQVGTLRSLHPTHSVCGHGPKAKDLLDGHALDVTPCGPNSSFARLRRVTGAQILFLGCGPTPNTSMHAVEEIVEPDYLFRAEPIAYETVDYSGTRDIKSYRQHAFDGVRQRYDRLVDLMSADSLTVGRVMAATCHLLAVEPMWDVALRKMETEPHYFVDTE